MLQLHRRAFTPFGFLAATALVCAAAARADCPVTDMQFNAGPPFSSSAADFDTLASVTKQAGYDVPGAALMLRHDGNLESFVRIRDSFVVWGVPTGTPVVAVLELVADGAVSTTGCGGANCWAYLDVAVVADNGSGVDSDGHEVVSGAEAAHADVGVPILFFAGTWKEIAIKLGARGSANHLVAATATFRFTALPSGAGITSCRGFVQAPTPALAASWGSVKAAYR